MLFSFIDPGTPITARFLSGQRFDLPFTVSPDAGQTISRVSFLVGGNAVAGSVALATSGLVASVSATGNFEIVGYSQVGRPAKNVIILLGDGMGIAHRRAARTMQNPFSIHDTQQPFDKVAPLVGYPRVNSTDSAAPNFCFWMPAV